MKPWLSRVEWKHVGRAVGLVMFVVGFIWHEGYLMIAGAGVAFAKEGLGLGK